MHCVDSSRLKVQKNLAQVGFCDGGVGAQSCCILPNSMGFEMVPQVPYL